MKQAELAQYLAGCAVSGTVIAIDGRCASGKTTFALRMEALGFYTVHADHFFLPPDLRTPERLALPGGNIHSERFLTEVAMPLAQGLEVNYRIFSCKSMDYTGTVHIPAGAPVIVEGAYCLHPDFGRYYTQSYFFDISPSLQHSRLAERCPEKLQDFLTRWIPAEERYFAAFRIAENAAVIR